MTDTQHWDQQQVHAWIADDPDPATRRELTDLLAAAEHGDDDAGRELADRFAGLLQFGTAGLRGAIGGGPNRMNRAVVIRAAAGLAAYLCDELAGEPTPPKVVIGYDARHRSADFAHDSAAVLTAAGLDVLLLPRPLPTPVLAFALRHLAADAGIMVTASHNPAADNGYKVYLGGRAVAGPGQGAQIVPPMDAEIAARIAAVPAVAAVPRAADGWTVLGEEVLDAYVAAVVGLAPRDDDARSRAAGLRIVLTPMHGVGAAVATRVLAAAGFTDVTVVPEQAEPDPDFPTVSFPNPEEPGALDLALALARSRDADLVLALDPDADRCAVAASDPRAGGWRPLHGDETGALLGSDAAAHASTGTLAASIVSSRLLSHIAAAAHLDFTATLTGFKWIARTDRLVFGYEEALGYCVAPALVRDKDGISASVRMATVAATLKAEGRGLPDELDAIARTHGLYLTGQVAVRFEDRGPLAAVVDRLRTAAPTTLAGSPVTQLTDLSAGADGLPPTDGFRLFTAADDRIVVRPSGTEPKVKCYLEVVVPLAADASYDEVTAARGAARARLDALARDVRAALGLPAQ
ncbi:MAG: phospho-sugar mutase [Micrococcales bacterium]|nr:phospho-sugar mutase [Micrococcales bacterium]